MRFKRIRTRIWAGMLGVVGLFGLTTAVIVSFVTSRVLTEEVEKRVRFIAQQTAQTGAPFIVTENTVALQLLLKERLAEKDVRYAFILDRDGRVLVHSFGASFPTDLKAANRADGAACRFSKLRVGDGEVLDVAAPILGGQLGTVRIGVSERGIRLGIRYVLAMLALIIAGVGVAVSWVATILSNRIAHPILRLADDVRSLRSGDLAYRVPVRTEDEIGELSRAFNETTEELSRITVSRDELGREVADRKRAEEALRHQHDHLEEMVRQRTAQLEADIACRLRAEEANAKLEAQLLQAQKMESIGRLAGGVAHDFNNMLGVILGNVNLLLADTNPAQPLSEILTEIRQAAERSANLTRQLLAFARRQAIAPRVLDLNETVGGMLNMLRRLIGENITLVWLPRPNLWSVRLDPSQVDQILANLCVNSRDAIADVG